MSVIVLVFVVGFIVVMCVVVVLFVGFVVILFDLLLLMD